MTYQVGQIVAWDRPLGGFPRVAVVRSVTARHIRVETLNGWSETFAFGSKGQRVDVDGRRWTLREPTKEERNEALCILAHRRAEQAATAAIELLYDVKQDPKIMEAIAARADLLLKTVKGFVK